jgi:hypothetical protein
MMSQRVTAGVGFPAHFRALSWPDRLLQDRAETPGGSMDSESPSFRRSSFCNAGGCVEVAEVGSEQILVRGTGAPNLIPLAFSADQWAVFVAAVKNGEFARSGR